MIAYCRIGERSSHTGFVLTNLLGYSNVRNYDGSWTEWGNSGAYPSKGRAPLSSRRAAAVRLAKSRATVGTCRR